MSEPLAPLYRTYAGGRSAESGWHPKIEDLLNQGHVFLACRFSEPGYLFRGYHIAPFGQSRPEHSLSRLEQRLDVYFVSHEPGDALTVARCWEFPEQAGVLVIASAVFNRALQAGRAAVLGFAEGGQVFRYPFFCEPPLDVEITAKVCCRPQPDAITFTAGAERMAARQAFTELTQQHHWPAAVPQPAANKPRRR